MECLIADCLISRHFVLLPLKKVEEEGKRKGKTATMSASLESQEDPIWRTLLQENDQENDEEEHEDPLFDVRLFSSPVFSFMGKERKLRDATPKGRDVIKGLCHLLDRRAVLDVPQGVARRRSRGRERRRVAGKRGADRVCDQMCHRPPVRQNHLE